MKKMLSPLPFVFMFGTLTLLLVFMCLPISQRTVPTVNGILDLGALGNSVYALDGQWQFYYGRLLTPQDISQVEEDADVIEVPSAWEDSGYPTHGATTYRLVIQTDTDQPLMLYIPEVASSYYIWINGTPAKHAGIVSASKSDAAAFYGNALIPVTAENGVVELVMQVSNYDYYVSGLKGSLLFGESGSLLSWFFRTRVLYCVAIGCVLMAAFYHLALYVFRHKEKVYLYFSALCFLYFLRAIYETNGLAEFFDFYNIKLYAVLFFLHGAAIMLFALYTFNSKLLIRRKYWFFAYALGGSLLFSVMPIDSNMYVMISTLAITPFSIFSIVVAARSPVLRQDKWSRLYFAALIIYFIVGTLSKLFLDDVLFMPGILSNMFMIMCQSLILSRRYTDAFRFVEETNANLEQLVDERTKSLQAANEAMQATNTAMKELVSNISHDLKTPLAVMSVNLETLSELAVTQTDADYQRHVRTAYQKNRDLQRLIQNLFEISRIETGRNLYSPKWESILHILAQVKEKYDTFLEDIDIAFDITVEDDIEISTDPQKVWSVFDNIIYNAARHTESGGSITITVHNMAQAATVTISDTGCGIAPEHLPHIFDRFYRASQARDAHEGESGLGLYIVKSIMEGCGGLVAAESVPGKGTSVILTFPARRIE